MMKKFIACIVCVVFLAGCASYYKVTDPASKSIYFTDDIDEMKNGAVKFKDAKTGSDVTLQSSEVKEIDSKEFEESTKPPQPAEKK
jgi:outer membrane murein-binding lipoprotein Lpp